MRELLKQKRIDKNSDFLEWFKTIKNENTIEMKADRLEMISYPAMIVYFIIDNVCHYTFVSSIDLKKNKNK